MLKTQQRQYMNTSVSAALRTAGLFVCLLGIAMVPATYAAEEPQGLQLPADLSEKVETGPAPKYTIEEGRVNGRLDRITVRRENGIDEVYDNTEVNSLWQTEDEELGKTQNLRRWTIGSW